MLCRYSYPYRWHCRTVSASLVHVNRAYTAFPHIRRANLGISCTVYILRSDIIWKRWHNSNYTPLRKCCIFNESISATYLYAWMRVALVVPRPAKTSKLPNRPPQRTTSRYTSSFRYRMLVFNFYLIYSDQTRGSLSVWSEYKFVPRVHNHDDRQYT